MSHASSTRKRSERVASLVLPPGFWERAWDAVRSRDTLLRVGLALAAAVLMWLLTGAWTMPFPYQAGYVPPRAIVSAVEFQRQREPRDVRAVYVNDPRELVDLRTNLLEDLRAVAATETFADVEPELWQRFAMDESPAPAIDPGVVPPGYQAIKRAMEDESQVSSALYWAFRDLETNGLLEEIQHDGRMARESDIDVSLAEDREELRRVAVEDVLIAGAPGRLRSRLESQFKALGDKEVRETLTRQVLSWVQGRLPVTLALNRKATADARVETFKPGDELAAGGQPLGSSEIEKLRQEHQAIQAQMSLGAMAKHSVADFGMYLALYLLCGGYIFFQEPQLLTNLRRYLTLLGLVVAGVALGWLASTAGWQAELVPMVLFGMTATLVYHRELALLLGSSVSLVVAVSTGQGLAELVVLVAGAAGAILMLGDVRSRTKLLFVGLGAALIVFCTNIGVGTLMGQPLLILGSSPAMPWYGLLPSAAWAAAASIAAGLIMTALLPFVERIFDVQTEMRLLELGDPSHPLLQELVRRAPGTYNHSINVASIAEAAGDAIGVNGLLLRVGAYFHDIGKVFQPSYFIENQGGETNRHDSLLPAMSTLVIIAHVKDGADLARRHDLPQPIIDFIEQHHGTTLVEYFYREATRQSEANPDACAVDETAFRYPGPKPQSKEAAVLMLADSVESACRVLVDPTPARIESRVTDIAMKKLLDGQFDECDLTLGELRTVESSLVKSLTAVYHGRVKYPDKRTA